MKRKIFRSLGFSFILMILSILVIFLLFTLFGSNGGDPLIVNVIFNVVAWPLLLANYLGNNGWLPFYDRLSLLHSVFYGFGFGWAAYSIIIFCGMSLFGKTKALDRR